uniref:Uncharacterized protein n=1 Tax=Hordeum vulgare subsp. vulgare TaxID=112509 RepID=A0A8I6YLQ4_HORVV
MDGRSATACVLVMLVLLGSTTSADSCFIDRFVLPFCNDNTCKFECWLEWTGELIHQHWCDGKVFGKCNCKICL